MLASRHALQFSLGKVLNPKAPPCQVGAAGGLEARAWRGEVEGGGVGSEADDAVATMEADRAALERATLQLQSPNAAARAEAEKHLLSLQALPVERLFDLVVVVLGSTRDVGTRFHGVQALRTSAVEKFAAIAPQTKLRLRDWAVESALSQRDEVVRSQLLALCAVLVKRSYLELLLEEKQNFFSRLRQHCGQDLFKTQVELELMQGIISEFSHETASSIGMPFAFHHECKQGFERDFLCHVFDFASSRGRDSYVAIKHKQQQGGQVEDQLYLTTIASVETMVQVLQTWDFRKRVPSRFFDASGGSQGATMSLKPGRAWRDRLLAGEALDWAYDLCHAAHSTSMDTPLASVARQLVVILASLHGDVFLPDDANYPDSPSKVSRGAVSAAGGSKIDSLKLKHLDSVQLAIQSILHPCDQVVSLAHNMQNEQRLRDGCTALCLLAEHNRLSVLTVASQRRGPQSGHLGIGALLSLVTLACIQCGGARDDQIDSAVGTSLTALLEAWDYLIQTECIVLSVRQQSIGQAQAHALHQETGIKDGAAHVFRSYLDSLLAEAAETALDDLDEEEEQQSLEMRQQKLGPISSISRVCAGTSFALIVAKLSEIQQAVSRSQGDEAALCRLLEQICCLLELTGYCVADPADGEVPLIPILLSQQHDAALGLGAPDPVCEVSNALLGLVQKLGQDGHFQSQYPSPRVLECTLQCLAKWSATYLISEDDKMPSRVREAFTEGRDTPAAALDAVVRLLGSTFVRFAGESGVQEQCVKHLLPALVQTRKRRVALVKAPSWSEFLGLYVQGFDQLSLSLRGDLHRHLVKNAVKAATKPLEEHVRLAYLRGLLDPTLKRVASLGGALDGKSRSVPMPQVEFVLEGLRGAAQSLTGPGLGLLLEIFATVQPVLLKLLRVQEKSPRAVYLVLRLTAETIESAISDITPQDFGAMLGFVYEVLGEYKKQNLGAVSLQRSKALKDEEQEEKYKNVRALLRLLTTLTERDMVDFTTAAGGGGGVDVANATFVGLEMVVPLLTPELLAFPKLSRQYFSLMGHMCEVYADRVCALPAEFFRYFVDTLAFGLKADDFQVVGNSLEALYHLSKAHLEALSRGQPGLGPNAQLGGGQGTFAGAMLKLLFHRLVYENYPSSLIDMASSALLALMRSDEAAFREVGVGIINSQAAPQSREALTATLSRLASVTAASDFSRKSRRVFGSEFQGLIISIRGIAKSV